MWCVNICRSQVAGNMKNLFQEIKFTAGLGVTQWQILFEIAGKYEKFNKKCVFFLSSIILKLNCLELAQSSLTRQRLKKTVQKWICSEKNSPFLNRKSCSVSTKLRVKKNKLPDHRVSLKGISHFKKTLVDRFFEFLVNIREFDKHSVSVLFSSLVLILEVIHIL